MSCPSGTHSVPQFDQCCGLDCVVDPPLCAQGEHDYAALRDKLLAESGALACKVQSDCTVLRSSTACGDPCAQRVLSAARAPAINAELSAWENAHCSTCMPQQLTCLSHSYAVCSSGVCVYEAGL
ncbi:MAG: hypothetical protein ABI548_02045 [Polyangiaceae bacterium]